MQVICLEIRCCSFVEGRRDLVLFCYKVVVQVSLLVFVLIFDVQVVFQGCDLCQWFVLVLIVGVGVGFQGVDVQLIIEVVSCILFKVSLYCLVDICEVVGEVGFVYGYIFMWQGIVYCCCDVVGQQGVEDIFFDLLVFVFKVNGKFCLMICFGFQVGVVEVFEGVDVYIEVINVLFNYVGGVGVFV